MTADLMDGAVNSAKILDESIMTIDLMDASVTSVKIADDAIMTNHIMDGQVMTADLMDNAVTTGKILDGEVMTADLADGSVTTIKVADNAITTGKILDGEVNTADLANGSVTTAKIDDSAVINSKIADLAVTNEKVSSQGQPQGKIMKADGAGGVSWEDDEGLILPWTGSYDGPGDAFTLTHTGLAGDGSAAVFNSTTATNPDPTVEIIKDVAAGAGAALAVRGIGVQGANYIATFTNNNLNEGRTVLMENDAPTQDPLVDPGTPGDLTDDYVNPDPTGTDVEDATLVLRNNDGAASGQKLALKTYGSIQANSAIQGTDLIAHNGEIIVNNTGLAGGTLFLTEDAMEKVSNPLAATEDFQMFNTGGDFDLNLDGHLDVRNQARIGDLVDENQVTVDGALTAVAIDLSNAGVPNVSPAGPGTATTVPTANADLLVNGDAELTGSLNLGGSADTYNSVNDIYISTDLTTLNPPAPAPSTTVIFESNDAQLISARAVEDALLNHDLQVAYNNGNSITSTDAQGDIDFNLEEATDFTITGANVGNDVIIDGAGYLDAQVNIINTSAGNAVIVEDDLEPDTDDTYNLGSDVNRWSNAYVNGGSVHVGPTGGQLAGTELAIGYNANAATLTVDNTLMANFNAGIDMITLDPDGASALPGQDELTINDANDVVMINADGANGQEVIVDGANDIFSVDADGDANNEINVAAAGVTIDGNSDGVNNVTVTGAAFNVDANGSTTNNITADGASFGVNADDANGNEIFANGTAVHLNANGDANIDVDVNGTSVDLDPNSNGTDNFSFAETGATISTTQATGDVVLSDAGVNAAAAQEFGFTATGGNLDVLVDGKINVEAAASTIGDAGDVPQLTVEGTATATSTDLNGLVVAPLVSAANTELIVEGDVQVDGSVVLGGHSVDNIFVQADLVGNLFPAPSGPDTQSNDGELVTALAVQTALLNHDLQVAYNNGNQIVAVDLEGDIDFDMTENTDFTVNLATANNNVVIDGLGTIDAQVNVVNTAGDVTVDDNIVVTGTSDLQNSISNTTANNAGVVLVDDAEGLQIDNGILNATFNGNTIGQTAPVDATNQLTVTGVATATTTDAAGAVTAAPADGASELTVTGDAQVNGSLTVGTAGTEHSIDNIFVQADLVGNLFPAPAGVDAQSNDGELVTALAVQTALLNHDLQVAYNNGNAIVAVDAEGDIDFDMTENTNFAVNLATANNSLLVDGLGITDIQTVIQASNDDIVEVDDNLLVNEDFDIRGDIYNEAGVNATPVTITDDVTMTMQDGDDNVEITAATTTGNLLDITKTAGDAAFAVEVNTNQSGVDVVTTNNNAVAYSTTLAGSNAVGYTVSTTGSDARNVTSSSTGANAIDVSATASGNTATAIQGTATGGAGVAVRATASGGNAVISSNSSTGVANSTVTVDNTTAAATSFAVTVENGNLKLSHDGAVTAANLPPALGTINPTSQTIVRATTLGGGNAGTVTLAAATTEGQVIIITNENAGQISITGGVAATYVIPGNEAAQFVYVNGLWYKMN